jgi:hypothetical protein
MLNASALVIGIDKYDLGEIPVLSGCVLDAFNATNWLLKLGVPAERIYLHVAKSTTSPANDPGVTVRAADLDSIIRSINALAAGQGDKLFVFMSGHGLYVRPEGPIFLTRDYGNPTSQKNLRIDEYVNYFLSWPYRDQFLFYDACQNPTAVLGQISPVQAQGPPATAGTYAPNLQYAMTACFSASAGQFAWAGTGRGVLVEHLLEEIANASAAGLSPTDRRQKSIIYDWSTGARQLDISILFNDVIAPKIQQAAGAANHSQRPYCVQRERALTEGKSPILDLPTVSATRVNVSVTPPEAVDEVKQINIVVRSPVRQLYLPDIGKPFLNPHPCVAPTGTVLEATCDTKDFSIWIAVNSPLTANLTGADVEVELQLAKPLFSSPPPSGGAPSQLNVRIVPRGGGAPNGDIGGLYSQIASNHGLDTRMPKGVVFGHNEIGPDISFDPTIAGAAEAAGEISVGWLKAIRRHVSNDGFDVLLSRLGEHADNLKPNVRFGLPENIGHLIGFLEESPVLSLSAAFGRSRSVQKLSMADIKNHPNERLAPGIYRIEIDLPWGRWSDSIYVSSDDIVDIRLPDSIGLPPLRNIVFAAADDGPTISLISSQSMQNRLLVLKDDDNVVGGLAEAGIDLLVTGTNGVLRVEPFSWTALPEWDLIFTAGRIDDLDAAAVSRLISAAGVSALPEPEQGLLLLALGYAVEARQDWTRLELIVGRLTGDIAESVDALLLKHAFKMKQSSPPSDPPPGAIDIKPITNALERGVPPLLRWGADLYQKLAKAYGVKAPEWLNQLDPGATFAIFTPQAVQRIMDDRQLHHQGVSTFLVVESSQPMQDDLRLRAELLAKMSSSLGAKVTSSLGQIPTVNSSKSE